MQYVTITSLASDLVPSGAVPPGLRGRRLSFTSVPVDSWGRGDPSANALLLNAYLGTHGGEQYGIAVSEPQLTWRPLESMLLWASRALIDESQLRYTPTAEEIFWSPEYRLQKAAAILDGESEAYRLLSAPVPDQRLAVAALPIYQSLATEQLFAVRNSPLKLASATTLVNAAVPGVSFLASDGDVVASVVATATSLFVTYIAVPSLRGVGTALEVVLHDWILGLRPSSRGAGAQAETDIVEGADDGANSVDDAIQESGPQ